MCADVSQRLPLPTAIDWPRHRILKLERIRFKEEMAHGYKKENEGSPFPRVGEGPGRWGRCKLEGQRFGHP